MTHTAEQSRAWYRENRDEIRARRKAARDADPEADRQSSRAWYKANKEWADERSRRYYAEHAEAIREQQRRYRESRKAEAVERTRAWRQTNPERFAVLDGRRRRRLRIDADLTPQEWADVLAAFDGHCAYCDRSDLPLQLEHLIPLARGGRHTKNNVAPACGPCNNRKHTKTADEFAGWTVPPRLTP